MKTIITKKCKNRHKRNYKVDFYISSSETGCSYCSLNYGKKRRRICESCIKIFKESGKSIFITPVKTWNENQEI